VIKTCYHNGQKERLCLIIDKCRRQKLCKECKKSRRLLHYDLNDQYCDLSVTWIFFLWSHSDIVIINKLTLILKIHMTSLIFLWWSMIHYKWNVNFILCVNFSWLMQTIMYLVDLKLTNIFFSVITCDENFALKECSFFITDTDTGVSHMSSDSVFCLLKINPKLNFVLLWWPSWLFDQHKNEYRRNSLGSIKFLGLW
jgi:hypothetical protein